MALRIYGVTDSGNGIDFIIRARSDLSAVQTVTLLQGQLDALGGFPILADDFDGPILIEGSLVSSGFDINGSVNGAST